MGRRKNKATKTAALAVTVTKENPIMETQPLLIPPTTFETLTEMLLRLPAPDRVLFLTMNEYRVKEINPQHVESPDAPTHVIIFCIRLIRKDVCHPIGAIQYYKDVDQSKEIAEVWKAFLHDLSILRVNVIASLSPNTEIFYKVLNHLTKIPNLAKYAKVITYKCPPYNEIIHFYNLPHLLSGFQSLFQKHNEVRFIAGNQMWSASWTDILLILASNNVDCCYTSDDPNAPPYDIFTLDFQLLYMRGQHMGILTTTSKSATDNLINLICPYTNMLEMERINLDDLDDIYHNLEDLRVMLASVYFKKIPDNNLKPCNNCNESKNNNLDRSHQKTEEVLSPRKGTKRNHSGEAFHAEYVSTGTTTSIKIDDHHMKNIFKIINNSLDISDDLDESIKPMNSSQRLNNTINKKPTCSKRLDISQKLEKSHHNFFGNENLLQKNCSNQKSSSQKLRQTSPQKLKQTENGKVAPALNHNQKNPSVQNIVLEYFQSLNDQYKNHTKKTEPKTNNQLSVKPDVCLKRDLSSFVDDFNVETKKVPEMSTQELDVYVDDIDRFLEHFMGDIKKDEGCNDLTTGNLFRGNDNLKEQKDKHNLSGYVASNDLHHDKILLLPCDHVLKDQEEKSLNQCNVCSNDSFEQFYANELSKVTLEETKSGAELCDSVDIQEYIESLKGCDKQQYCDNFKIREQIYYELLLGKLTENFEQFRLSNDWLSTIKGMVRLKNVLKEKKVKELLPTVFVLDHIDFLVCLIKKTKNKVLQSIYMGKSYRFLDYKCAFNTLYGEVGLYVIQR